ncbi:MAG: hypothetical protein GEU76_01120 [Alphaproteobacteria bacterium]|nr:hypothetical protein [Alphaproteobacteria bacterium]
MLGYAYDDGGRPPDLPRGTGDCAARAIARALGFTYPSVAAHLLARANCRVFTATQGCPANHVYAMLEDLGWRWQGAPAPPRIPLGIAPVPDRRRVVAIVESHRRGGQHASAIVNDVVHDLFDSRERLVIGYFVASPAIWGAL